MASSFWFLQSADRSIWNPTVDTNGVVTFTSTSSTANFDPTTVTFPGVGIDWLPIINNDGTIDVFSNDFALQNAYLTYGRTRWTFSVDSNGVISLTSSLLHRWELLPHARGAHS